MILTKRAIAPIAIAGLITAVAGAQLHLHGRLYYSNVVITTHDNLSLEFLNEGVSRLEDCQAAAAMIADTIRASCPACTVTKQQCPGELEGPQQKLLSEEPIEPPSSRLPHGVVAYISGNIGTALAACQETERVTGLRQGFRAICYPPNTPRPLASSTAPKRIDERQALVGLMILLVTAAVTAFIGYLIVRYEPVHAHWSHDPADGGPQKFHVTPTPRIGGLGVMAGLFVSGAVLLATEQGVPGEQFGYLLLASLPAFLGGITEDVTKMVSVAVRLMLTMLAAAIGAWLLGAVIPRLDIPGFDVLLGWTPFAIAFTIFAVGGVANAINIIDGYNGLAAGHAVIVLSALAYVSAQTGDGLLFTSTLAMGGALLGFLIWNYPKGKIFLGDGGAYLLGFWLAELSVLLVARHPDVSPWFPMLLLIYPIFETLFSIYRRKVIHGVSPGQPDRLHMHQVIYMRLTRAGADTSDPASITHLNNMVAPFSWLMTLCCGIPALIFWRETQWLMVASLLFCVGYVSLYGWLFFSSRGRI